MWHGARANKLCLSDELADACTVPRYAVYATSSLESQTYRTGVKHPSIAAPNTILKLCGRAQKQPLILRLCVGRFCSCLNTVDALSTGQLKEMVKALEKLNGTGRWRWLLHYKESKKLKEDVR